MIVERKLKWVKFIYDLQLKQLYIRKPFAKTKGVESVSLTRIEMFSLARFILRVAQKPQKRWKATKKT